MRSVVCDAAVVYGDVTCSDVFILFIITCKLSFGTTCSQFNSFVSGHFKSYQFCLLCFVLGYVFLFWGCQTLNYFQLNIDGGCWEEWYILCFFRNARQCYIVLSLWTTYIEKCKKTWHQVSYFWTSLLTKFQNNCSFTLRFSLRMVLP